MKDIKEYLIIGGADEGDVVISPGKRTKAMMVSEAREWLMNETPDIYDESLLRDMDNYYPSKR
jgi:hypothetical protein